MEEHMEVCYKLWNSWEPDAVVADRATGIFADPAKVHEVQHVGEFFRCKGRSFVFMSPQGRPVLWQAGSLDRGRDFAAKHAEAIFAVHPNVERMREYTDDLNLRLETRFGRHRDSVKRIYGIQTVVGVTRSEAQEKYERIQKCIPLEGAMAIHARMFRGIRRSRGARIAAAGTLPYPVRRFDAEGESTGILSTVDAPLERISFGVATPATGQAPEDRSQRAR